MAGNNSIQILRATRQKIIEEKDDLTLLDGQPLYNMTDGYLSIGGGQTIR